MILSPPAQSLATDTAQIHKAKAEKARDRALKEEMDAKRAKTKAARERGRSVCSRSVLLSWATSSRWTT